MWMMTAGLLEGQLRSIWKGLSLLASSTATLMRKKRGSQQPQLSFL
uniref:Alternative protein MDC1 n=1 Tax=Homo sapiens TaxID=9606 RepID=L8E828_HUMAN|nr:alternative protein MDC1 [Homo sapiens]